ncbi:MAG: CopD family protein [Gammaproteobacteria bacterium]|nr:CopD family protein [Gammaproteobacteria bacterium]
MLWIKAFHIIFMVTWFAGLFYLPRLFVYHCAAHDAPSHARFCTMERRLLRLMTVGGALTVAFGVWLWTRYWLNVPAGWLHVKLSLAVGLIAYHGWLWKLHRDFVNYDNRHSARFYRVINEIPTLFLIAMVILAIVKPM